MIIQRGSYGITYTFTYLTSSGVAKDLSNCTAVNLVVWQPGNPQLVLLNAVCSISSPATSGVVTFSSTATDFIQGGVYCAELRAIGVGTSDPSQMFIITVVEAA